MKENIPRKAHDDGGVTAPILVSLRCPDCGRHETFEPVQAIHDFLTPQSMRDEVTPSGQTTRRWIRWRFGQRRCPFPECHAHVFVILENEEVVASYPPETIDFDKEGIPEKITQTLEEAIICYAQQCYIAAAIMVRRTLEDICEDRDATGDNLWKRIRRLKDNVVISEGLLEGMGNLILLGNDAAHVESRTFEQVSVEEVHLGIGITKEILRAVYQEKNLVERLNQLKRNTQ
jgi:hypothetical protein